MKYYIATSSLNLDNILQSESISPLSFYLRRKTGYTNFEIIPELREIKAIVLFADPIIFSIKDHSRYNDPILIEIDDELQLNDKTIRYCQDGVYSYNRTLYLTPYNCRIFFFSEGAYKLTTINTKDNKSLKHYDKYRIYPTVERLAGLKNMPLIKVPADQTLGSSSETINDKKKGLLYAYLLGQSLSLTPELAHQKYLTQEIYNTYAGINSYLKTNKRIPNTYIEKLEEQFDAYKAIDQIERKNQDALKERIKKDSDQHEIGVENLIELLKSWGKDIWDLIFRRLSNKYNTPILPLVSELRSGIDYTRVIEQVELHTEQSIASYKNGVPKPSLNTIKVDGKSIAIDEKDILNIAINYIVDEELTPDKLVANRADICSRIINQIKAYFISSLGYSEEQWHDDPHRQYALCLYNNINDYRSSFSLNDAKELKYSAEFIAIAAFILRGESIDSYLKYLLKNEVADYSLPLALWGALCGYMEMNRGLLSEFLTDETYESVYEHLYGTKLYKATFNDGVATKVQQLGKQKEEGFVRTDDFLFVVERAKIDDIYYALKTELNGEHIDLKILNGILGANKRKKKQCDTARNIFNHIASKEYNGLEKLIPTKKNWLEIIEHFGIKNPSPKKYNVPRTRRNTHKDNGGTFDFPNAVVYTNSNVYRTLSIIDDDNAQNIIRRCPSLGKSTMQVLDIFIDFQKSYRPEGFRYENPDKYKRNNSEVIKTFCNWCFYQGNKKALIDTNTNRQTIEELKKYLLGYYHD